MNAMTDAIGSLERARRYAARFPHLARKIMGQPPVFLNAKETLITVNLQTGERSLDPVVKAAEPAPAPIPRAPIVRRILPPHRDNPRATWRTDDEKARLLADEFSGVKTDPPRVGEIMKAVCDAAGITMAEMRGPGRLRKIARPRQLAMVLTIELRPKLPLTKIGFLFSHLDHTSAEYARKVVPRYLLTDPGLAAIYDKAMEALSNNHKEAA